MLNLLPLSLLYSSRPRTFPAPFGPFDSIGCRRHLLHRGSPSPVTCSSAQIPPYSGPGCGSRPDKYHQTSSSFTIPDCELDLKRKNLNLASMRLPAHPAGWMAHRKCVNFHGSLQRRRSSLDDELPSCPLRLSAAVTLSPPAKRSAFAKHQFVSVKPCLCIHWSYFQIFIPWKPTLTSGEHILSGSWPFRPAEMNPAVYSCPPFIFYCMRYIVPLFLLLPDIWLLGRSGQNVHWEFLSHSKDSCCPFLLHCFLLTIPVQNNWGNGFSSFFISGLMALISVFLILFVGSQPDPFSINLFCP